MKYVLIIWVCSFLGQNTCLPPFESAKMYDSWYACSVAAHAESRKILTKIGYKEVNDNKIGTRYSCNIIPTT